MLKLAKSIVLLLTVAKMIVLMIPRNKNKIVRKFLLFQMPKTQESWKRLARQFGNTWNFDNCIGAVDGRHITLQKPEHSGSYYYNYEGTYSIVLMGIANAIYSKIISCRFRSQLNCQTLIAKCLSCL